MNNIVIEAIDLNLKYKFIRNMNMKHEIVRSFLGKGNSTRKKEVWALKNLSFQIKKGQTVGIIGSNGSGKTTLLKTIAGIFKPDSGQIHINTESISLLTLGAGFQNELSGFENIYINGLLLGFTKKQVDEQIDDIIGFSELGDFIYNPLKTYSSGMKSRLAFAIASQVEPDILLIDEVLGVGDESFKKKSYNRMTELINSHRTVILVSHSLPVVESMCNKVLWIEKGEFKQYGNTKEVVAKYREYMRK